jgi:hypothetical protein
MPVLATEISSDPKSDHAGQVAIKQSSDRALAASLRFGERTSRSVACEGRAVDPAVGLV